MEASTKMASTIKIKRSGTSGNPTTLGQGELAYSYFNGTGGDRLYVGTGTETAGDAANHQVIGGKYYIDLLGGSGVAPFGTLTANTALIADSNSKLDVINIDNVTINGNTVSTSSGNLILDPTTSVDVNSNKIINLATPTANTDAATKAYVDNQVSGVTFSIADDDADSDSFSSVSGVLTFTGGTGLTSNVSDDAITFTLDNTAVTAGSYGSATAIPTFTVDAQGRLTAAGTANVATNLSINVGAKTEDISLLDSDLSFAASGSDGLSVAYDSATNQIDYTVANADISGTKGVATFTSGDFTASSGTISLADDVVKDITTDTGALTPSSHGFSILGGEGMNVTHSGTAITVAGEDATASNKGVASFSSDNFAVSSGAVTIKDGGVANAELANSSVTFGSTEVALGASSTSIAGVTQLDVDNIRIDGNTISTTDTNGIMYLDPNPSGDSGDLHILGNLTVQGTTTTINSTEVSINDLTLTLADSAANAAAADGAGIIIDGASATFTYDATNDRFAINKALNVTSDLLIGGVGFNELVDDRCSNLFLAGEGIDLAYDDGAGSLTVSAELATTSNPGVASFNSTNFDVSGAGAVTIDTVDGGSY